MHRLRSGAIEGYEQAVSSLGGNPQRLLRQVGIASAQLRQPDTIVSYEDTADLLDLTSIELKEPFFALHLAVRQSPLVTGELALSSGQQASLEESLAHTNRYFHLHATGVRIDLVHHDERVECQFAFDFSNDYGLIQIAQLSVAQLFNAVSLGMGIDADRLQMHLLQHEPDGSQAVPVRYRSRLRFGSHFIGVSLPASWLARPPELDKELLRQHFEARTRHLEALYPNDLQAQVRFVVSSLLASSECSIERVASALGLHARVLQKRLQQQGVQFTQLLADTRLQIAQQVLQQGRMSITELALHLGYAEVAVFSRQFKRWTGQSPRAWQQAMSGPQAAGQADQAS